MNSFLQVAHRLTSLYAFLPAILLVLTLSCFLTLFLLVYYVRSVQEQMRGGMCPAAGAGETPKPPEREFRSEHYRCRTPWEEFSRVAPEFGPHADRARLTAQLVYGAAGGAYVLTALLFMLHAAGFYEGGGGEQPRFFSMPTLTLAAGLLWPIIETQVALSGARWQKKLLLFLCYLGAVWAAAWLAFDLPAGGLFEYALAMVFMVSVPTLAKWVTMNSWLKAAGVSVLMLCSGVVGGVLLGMWAGRRVSDPAALPWVLCAYLAAAGFGVGWLSVKWLVRRHVGRSASDQTVITDIYWLMLTEWLALLLVTACDTWRGLLVGFAFAGYALTLVAGFRLRALYMRGRPPNENLPLLLLRTFTKHRPPDPAPAAGLCEGCPAPAAGKCTRDPARDDLCLCLRRICGGEGLPLLRALETRWRYVGSIQLIAGPDLASSYLDVNEFADWLTGHFGDHFIKTDEGLRQRLEKIEMGPTPDGRYRVNEFFCNDAMWGKALAELLDDKVRGVVLMDLRGFTTGHSGVLRELAQLIDKVPAEEIVFVVDGETVPAALEKTLRGFWGRMDSNSPNGRGPEPALRFFHADGPVNRAAPRLFALLLRAAEARAARLRPKKAERPARAV